MALDNDACISPLIDPRDGLKIYLNSSKNGIGLYNVPENEYGTVKGDILKIDCKTAKVIGIVKY